MTNEINNFIEIIENKSKIYSIDKMVSICKRLNNKNRDFLFVNVYQGKHFPQNPINIFKVLDELVENIERKDEKILVIGFAETATAIGNYVSAKLKNCVYEMQTTREIIKDENVLIEFKEEHSHAPNQILYGNKEILFQVDKILFVEDEITTGKTIINFINEINKINPNLKYAVVSILNWQDKEASGLYSKLDIETYYLVKGSIKDINNKVDVNTLDEEKIVKTEKILKCANIYNELCDYRKTRLGRIPIKDLDFYSEYIFNKIKDNSKVLNNITEEENKDILIIGTEEFMYEPLLFARYLETNTKNNIFFQATTRSPIEVSNDNNYILNKRYKFRSCYESDRTTYLYNLRKYDYIMIVTDVNPNYEFIQDISSILKDKSDNIEILCLGGE